MRTSFRLRRVGPVFAGLTALFCAGMPALAAPPKLVGVARIASDARDSLGETLGGMGSGMALLPGSWHATTGGFTARLAMLPDRGWNTQGTSDYRARLQFFDLTLTPHDDAPGVQTGLDLRFDRSLLLTDAAGAPTTGLDPSGTRPGSGTLPDLPLAANGRVSLDDEALSFARDGTFWIGDEYGPGLYRFDADGKMIGAIPPPQAILPFRGDKENFSAGETVKGEPDSGRQNNQGFEGVSLSPDGRHLFAMTQSALVQDLDTANVRASRNYVRLLDYAPAPTPRLAHEYVVRLPSYDGGKAVAAQSEMLALNDHQFLLLCRDSGAGFTGKRAASAYRVISLVDTMGATDIAGRFDAKGQSIAPKGKLRDGLRPARLTPLLDMNDNAQLVRFGLHNGEPNDRNGLYEKWESMALAPAGEKGNYFLLVGSDNDFITQKGVMAGKPYADASGANVDSLVLVYRLALPMVSPAP